MKRILVLVCALFLTTATAEAFGPQGPVATAPGQNKIQCFSGSTDYPGTYNGDCVLNSKGAKGSATLNTVDNDADPYNNYAGVYTNSSNMYGQLIGAVSKLSFSYTGEATAGSPRFSIPVDTDGNGTTDQWAFISAYYCNDGAGLVDAINDSTCTIYVGTESFNNWNEMVTAHPTWKIGTDQYVFLIADDPGTWTVNNVSFGKPGK